MKFSESPAFTVEAHQPGRYVAASADDLMVFCWIRDADVAGVRFLHQMCEKQTRGRTRVLSAIHVIHPRVSLPSAEVRAQLILSMQTFVEVTCCIGVVLPGTGFWASAMRSALTGIRMLAPVGASQMRFGQTADEVVTWLVAAHHDGTGKPLGVADPRTVVQQVCSIAESET